MSTRDYGIARVVIPVSLTAFFLFLSRSFLGIPLGDDSLYMADHTQMLVGGVRTHLYGVLRDHDWGPLYVLWFRLLSYLIHDPVARYFASWVIIVVLVTLVPTFFRRPAAWLYTLIILALPMLIEGPFVAQFASVMVLIALCWLLRRRLSFAEALCAACVLSFCVKFCRPEYSYGVYLAAGATIVAVIVEQLVARRAPGDRRPGSSTVPAWLLLGTVTGLSAAILSLTLNFPSHRSGMAFAQHYNIRATIRGLIPLDPNNWRSNYAELRFGVDTTHNAADGVATIDQFIRANPRLFLAHVFYNAIDIHNLLLLGFAATAILLPWFWKCTASLRPVSLFLLLVCLPPIAGSVVIFPALNYASIVVPSLLLFVLQVVDPERWLRPSVPWTLLGGFALLTFLYGGFPHRRDAPVSLDRLNLYRIQCVRQWDEPASKTNPSVFSATGIFPVYLHSPRVLVSPSTFSTWPEFQRWAEDTRPDWISIDPPQHWIFGDHSVSAQFRVTPQQLDSFLQDKLGYKPHPCRPDAQLTVYTRGTP